MTQAISLNDVPPGELRIVLRAIADKMGILAPFMIFAEGLPEAPKLGPWYQVNYAPPPAIDPANPPTDPQADAALLRSMIGER
jgi:hypothetical protein